MSILVEWDNVGRTALRLGYENTWNWRDHMLALDAANTLMNTVQHPVDLVLDLQHSMPLPESTTWHVTQPHARLHDNWSGRTIIISPNGELARAMLEAAPALPEKAEAMPDPC
ncbi:MAG: hypothetical protein JXN59_18805 [Anaerolineae bacterium]|nr:hypothetical protein [Anaerolineae bacterium]